MKSFPKLSVWCFFALLACKNDTSPLSESEKQNYRNLIGSTIEAAEDTSANQAYFKAFKMLQNVLNQLPEAMKQDTPVDYLYHKIGLYAYNAADIAESFSEKQKYARFADLYYDTAYRIRLEKRKDHWLTHKTSLNIGKNKVYNLSNCDTAQFYLERALFNPLTDKTGMAGADVFLEADILYNLGISLEQLGDYQMAASFALRADSVFRVLKVVDKPQDSNDLQNYYNNLLKLGDIYVALKDAKCFNYFNKVASFAFQKQGYGDIYLASILNRGIAYRLVQNLKDAETDLQAASKRCTEQDDSANVRIELAKLYLDKGSFQIAEDYALQSLKMRSDYPKEHIVSAEIYTVLGQIYLKTNQLEKAKKAFQDALGDLKQRINPKSEIHIPQSYHSSWQIEAATQLADLQSKSNIEQAAQTYQMVSDLLYQRKSFFKTDAAKINITQQARMIFDRSIDLNRQLHQKTGKIQYLDQILTDMERSKAVLMSETIQDARITQYIGVPDSLRRQERQLRFGIAQVERNRLLNPKAVPTDLSEVYQKWQTFVQDLKQKFPKYYRFKHDVSARYDVQSIQKQLPKETAAIHYYLGNNHLHILVIDNKSAQIHTQAIEPAFDTAFNRYQYLIAQEKWMWEKQTVFNEASYQLYQYLLAKPLKMLSKSCKNLLLLPDDKLASLAFAALLTDSISQNNPRPYLIQKYALNTAYTIAECGFRISDFGMKGIPQSAIHNPQSEFVYAGFSHGFDGIKSNEGSKKTLDELPASKAHIEKIHQWYRKIGKSYHNTTMTRQDFMAIAPKSRITEIATHAGFDAQDSRRTSIYFPKQDTTEALELSTIYNMNWSANELLVLIACQTAKGLVIKGETVISIAYAFGYAGAQRRIAALWSISNDASVDLMNAFFQNLLKDNHPAWALQQAQCQLLDNTALPSDAKTPNKWAGLALSGNIAAISE